MESKFQVGDTVKIYTKADPGLECEVTEVVEAEEGYTYVLRTTKAGRVLTAKESQLEEDLFTR